MTVARSSEIITTVTGDCGPLFTDILKALSEIGATTGLGQTDNPGESIMIQAYPIIIEPPPPNPPTPASQAVVSGYHVIVTFYKFTP